MNRSAFCSLFKKLFFSGFFILISSILSSQVPTITSFSPASGPIGTEVTITGTNFDTTPANNIVWFGAVKATVTAASATELSVMVPERATYQHITVTVNGLTAYSSSLFNYTFPSLKVIDASTFYPRVDFNAGTNPSGSALADIDGDGKTDLITVNSSSNSISVFRYALSSNDISSASFNKMVEFSTGSNPSCVATGDIDGDGKTDIAVANSSSNSISVLRNISTSGSISAGSFEAKVDFTTGNVPYDVAIRDIDGDGKPDLIVTNNGSNSASILRNLSTPGTLNAGSFDSKVDLSTGMNPYRVAIDDIDGDGKPDLAVNNYLSNSITVYRNISTSGSITPGSFETSVDFTTGMSPLGLSLCDIDGNGKKDLIVNYFGWQTLSIFKNISTSGTIDAGTFDNRVDLPLWITGPGELTIGDIDGDGKPDLAVSSPGRDIVSVFRNTSTYGSVGVSSFSSGSEFHVGTSPKGVEIGDLNGDGKPEIIVVNSENNNVSVLRNAILLPTKPTIISVVPSSGPVGTTVTITGTNFSAEPAENIVWFGAVRASVTSATTIQLTVTVPAGATYNPVTVTKSGLTASSRAPFNVTFPGILTIDGTSFDAKVNFVSELNPCSPAAGDFDGDGKPDLVLVDSGNDFISVYRNTSNSGTFTTGSFAPRVDFSSGSNPHGIAVGDIDGDGKQDIVIANYGSNSVSVFRNTAASGSITTGSFAARIDFTTGANPYDVAIGDIDGDGKLDLAVTNYTDNTVSIFKNTSNPGAIYAGSLAARVDFATGANPYSVILSDFNLDSWLDMVVTNRTDNTITAFRNTAISGSVSPGTFMEKATYSTGGRPNDAAVGDIDGDGNPDLVVLNDLESTMAVFRNASSYSFMPAGWFPAKVEFATSAAPTAVTIGDINGDGKQDIVVSNTGTSASVFRNTSGVSGYITAGTFAPGVEFTTDVTSSGVAICDLDGDGKPDIIVTNSGGNNVSVLRNVLQVPVPPVINSFTPASGAVGTTVTINGSGFSTTLSDNYVWFGPVKAAVNAATTSQLTVTIPAGAAYQPISVTVNGMTARSNSAFIVTFAGTPEVETSAFSAKIDLPVGTSPSSVAAGDIDEDGKPDLFVTNINNNNISAFRNTNTAGSISAGLFGPRTDIPTGMNPNAIVISDIDGDGKLDMVVANGSGSSSVSVFRNNGTSGSVTGGSFDPRVDLPAGSSSNDVAVGDIDGDGKPDLVVTNFNNTFISIYRNISTPGSITTGSFSSRVDFPSEMYLQNIVLADIDGDLKPDLIAPHVYQSRVFVYRNISSMGSITTGSFAPKVDFITGMNPIGLAVGDLDGDGKPEIVVANNMDNNISVLHNTCTPGSITAGSFEPRVNISTGGISYVSIGDINGDGKPDLIVKGGGPTVSVLRNKSTTGSIGTDSFSPAVEFATDGGTAKTIVSDFDCDGKPDIAYINSASNQLSILRNKVSEYPPPVITSFNPVQGPVGTTVTINGSNFSSTPADNTVFFGTIQATILTATATQLTVTVPAGATNSVITVTTHGQTTNSATTFTVAEPTPPPVITSFHPTSGQTHWTVIIIGTNFSTNPANNIVWFGAVQAQVTAATATELSVTVPAGATYKPITVTVNGLTAYSAMPYNNIFPGLRTIDASTLSQRVDFPTNPGSWSDFTEICDLDVDGKPDLIFGNSGYVSILRNRSTYSSFHNGSMDTRVDLNSGGSPRGIAVGDIDGDGKPDIAFANESNNTVSIFRNISAPGSLTAGSFDARVDIPAGIRPEDVAIGDIDGDGKSDLAVVNYGDGNDPATGTVSILRNIGSAGFISSGSFAGKVDFQGASQSIKVRINDIDGDRKPDIIITRFSGSQISIFRNTATPGSITLSSLASKVDINTGLSPYGFDIGDLDGDGKLDLAVLNSLYEGTTVSVYRNISTPGSITNNSFASKVDFTTGPNPKDVAIGDIDGDGKPDMVVANENWNTVSVFKNNITSGVITTNSFASKVDFTTGSGPGGLAIGDLDADGKPEVVVRSFYDGIITVLRNTTITPNPPQIAGLSTTSGPVGSAVTINGANFSPTPEENVVMFGDVQATVTEASPNQLTVIVPVGADGQPVIIMVNGYWINSGITFSVVAPTDIELESSILTLNGDGINEHFVVKNFQIYGTSKLYVYNGRGALVYWNTDFQGEWDVTLHNRRFDTGGYFYVIETSFGTFRGSFSILK